jgi:uncharacterized protein (TIGR03086 family)
MFKSAPPRRSYVVDMTDHDELPIYPTAAPAIFCDIDAIGRLFGEVLECLAEVVELEPSQRSSPTPCAGFDAGTLQHHVLGWLGFFASALDDPSAQVPRVDPTAYVLPDGASAAEVVRRHASTIGAAVGDGVAAVHVVMLGSRMMGDGVLAMALGEYLVHAWDLAKATGRAYDAPVAAVAPAHEFLLGMIAPEHRGPDSGFFDAEVPVAAGASPLDRLLGFAGRDPGWSA